MDISRIEFDDPDDARSHSHPDYDGGIRFTITPEGLVVALPNGSRLAKEDQVVLGQMLRLAYYQGKEVGKLLGEKNDKSRAIQGG